MSSLLSYHIFSFFISNIFENFKFGRNFSKFTAGMGCRLVAVSVKIGGNRRLPIGKENTAWSPVHTSSQLASFDSPNPFPRQLSAIPRPVSLLLPLSVSFSLTRFRTPRRPSICTSAYVSSYLQVG